MWITSTDLSLRLSPQRYNDLLDDTGDGAANTDVVAAVINDAEAEANSYLARRYEMSLLQAQAGADPSLANALRGKVLDLAEWYAETRRPRDVPQSVTDKHDAAIRWFKDVSSGLVSLGVSQPPTESSTVGGHVGGNEREFTRRKTRGL